ncbi:MULTISPECIES: radical SAM protein [Nocardia]|uniref:radical SAM protein n=1 Tax=Nocardia TaxID=1817 RepID=UPI0006D04213|nr:MULTISPECIES: radical SAM protein [Nocardia]
MVSVLPAAATDLRRRFTYRPDIGLLYDARHGLEHRLDHTAAAFVEATFDTSTDDPVSVLAARFSADSSVLATDLAGFWSGLLEAGDRPHSRRRSGAPPEWAAKDLDFPLALEVEITRVCNWHCDFCYNVWKVPDDYGQRGTSVSASAPGAHMSIEVARSVIEQAAAGGCLRMRFSGGEPTLHPDCRDIIATAAEAGMDVELFTNGVRLTDSEAARLAGLGLRVALLSVHGLDATHTAMARNPAAASQAWRGMAAAVGAGLRTVAETLVCEDNLDQMPELTRRLIEIGVHDVSFMPYVPFGKLDPRRPVALRRLAQVIDECRADLEALRVTVPCAPKHCLESDPTPITAPVRPEFDRHCAAGLLWASVSVDGRLRHCPHSAVYAGPIQEGIAGLWRTRMVPTVRAALAPTGACGGCGQLSACGGGCHLGKITSYGTGTGNEGRTLLPLSPAGTATGQGCGR